MTNGARYTHILNRTYHVAFEEVRGASSFDTGCGCEEINSICFFKKIMLPSCLLLFLDFGGMYLEM